LHFIPVSISLHLHFFPRKEASVEGNEKNVVERKKEDDDGILILKKSI